MAVKWSTGRVTEKTVWTEGLFTIQVEVPDLKPFEPGQFLQIALDIDGERVNRPYSVASPHGERIEFFIVVVEDGRLTPHLWKLKVGDPVEISQRPAGSFTLKKTPDAENLWLVSTGTGLAPYIAMLRTPEPWDRFPQIVVVHGVRFAADLGYADELRQMAERRGGQLVYIPTMTRESGDGILQGRIPSLLDDGRLEAAAQCRLSADDSAILLCGNPAMLDDMESKMAERGMKRHRTRNPGQIVVERYW